MTNLVIDLSNVIWGARFGEFKGQHEREFTKELLTHSVIDSLLTNYIKFKPDGILLACDGKNGWRHDIYPAYKANRKKDLYYVEVNEVLANIQRFFAENTAITTVCVDGAEADDVVFVATQLSPKTIIVSSDKDFLQLINEKTRLYAPTLKLERTSEDPRFDLFLKCIRGDRGDNIMSAYPRVREAKLLEAYEDTTMLKMINLMETKLSETAGDTVGANYEFNRKLIDLTQSPAVLRHTIENRIKEQIGRRSVGTQLEIVKSLAGIGCQKLAKEVGNSYGFYTKRFHL